MSNVISTEKIKIEQKSDTVSHIHLGDKEIILIGTAHMSHDSVDEVSNIIDEQKPDHVCVEIDAGRFKTMTQGQDWKSLSIFKVIKQKKGFLLLANLVLGSYQKRIGVDVGLSPGEEMLAAVKKAEAAGIEYSFADREVQTTLRRAWRLSSLWNKMKLLSVLLSSIFTKEKLSEDDIEKLKKKSALEDMMEEMAKYLPAVKKVFIDERDRFLATKVFNAPGKKIVAIVGAGHMNGIVKNLEALEKQEQEANIEDIDIVPKPAAIKKIIPWIVPAAILGLIVYGFIGAGKDVGLDILWKWVYLNGSLAALGGIIALANPLVILLAFPLAPITSLNPLMGVGIICGLVQSGIRKPRVIDFERLNQDILSVKGFYKNRVTHALVVMLLISVGSIIGTFLGGVGAAEALGTAEALVG